MNDCRTCGFPFWRESHASWCERVREANRPREESPLVEETA